MRNLIYCATMAMVSVSLAAQTAGRLEGTVRDTAGNPIPNVSMTLSRLNVNLSRTIRIDARGNFRQVGLDPFDYRLEVVAEGYVTHTEQVKIPINEALTRNIVLRKPHEAPALGDQDGVLSLHTNEAAEASRVAGTTRANEGIGAYNEAVALFNQQDYVTALARVEAAIEGFNELLESAGDETTKAEVEKNLAPANKLLAFSLFETGKSNTERRNELWLRAEPILLDQFQLTPDDATMAQCLADIAGMKGDTAAQNKYIEIVERIEGPKAENSYNRAVDFFNNGDYKDALPHLRRAIEINPTFSETYYLLGICEFSEENIPAAKAAFQKYLELDPRGKYAEVVKEMLSDPSLR